MNLSHLGFNPTMAAKSQLQVNLYTRNFQASRWQYVSQESEHLRSCSNIWAVRFEHDPENEIPMMLWNLQHRDPSPVSSRTSTTCGDGQGCDIWEFVESQRSKQSNTFCWMLCFGQLEQDCDQWNICNQWFAFSFLKHFKSRGNVDKMQCLLESRIKMLRYVALGLKVRKRSCPKLSNIRVKWSLLTLPCTTIASYEPRKK